MESNLTENISAANESAEKVFARNAKFYSLIVVISIGVFCNMLTLVVLAASHIKKTSTGVYLTFLALADTTALTGEFLRWLNTTVGDRTVLGISIMHDSKLCCKLVMYIRYFGRIWSSWLIVIITVERYLSISRPLRANSISNPRRAVFICILEMTLVASVCIPCIFTVTPSLTGTPPSVKCAIDQDQKQLYQTFEYAVIFSGEMILPSLIVLTFTILILYHLYRANHLREAISISQAGSHSSQLTSTLLGLALTFVFIRLPYIIMHKMDASKFGVTQFTIKDISYVLSVTNYAINFFLYCLCGSVFRKELLHVLRCKCMTHKRPSTTYIMDLHSGPASRHRLSRVQDNGIMLAT